MEPIDVFKEKRRWQIALRRYILEKKPSTQYVQYYGITIASFREWIAMQFVNGQSWDNFGNDWQFEHVIPVAYFDLTNEADNKLCWNFTNIHVSGITAQTPHQGISILAAKKYFEKLYQSSGYPICKLMLAKIDTIEQTTMHAENDLANFLHTQKDFLAALTDASTEDYLRLNDGLTPEDFLLERTLFQKFAV